MKTAIFAVALCAIAFRPEPSHAQVVTRPAAGGTYIEFRDPAYGDAWRQMFVPRVQVSVVASTHIEPLGQGWRYHFDFLDQGGSEVRYWHIQLASRTSLSAPANWRCIRSGPAESIIECMSSAARSTDERSPRPRLNGQCRRGVLRRRSERDLRARAPPVSFASWRSPTPSANRAASAACSSW